jgi:hypothetical protein
LQRAAEQRRNRQTQRFALRIQQRGFNGGFGKGVAFNGAVHTGGQRIQVIGRLPFQQRRQVMVIADEMASGLSTP